MAHGNRHPAVAPLLESRIHPPWTNGNDCGGSLTLDPCPCLLLLALLQHPSLPLLSLIPAKDIPKLAHEIRVSKVISHFVHELRSMDEFLGEKIHELEELVGMPDAVEEVCIVWWEVGRQEG